MIIKLRKNVDASLRNQFIKALTEKTGEYKYTVLNGVAYVITTSGVIPGHLNGLPNKEAVIEDLLLIPTEYQLSTRAFQASNTIIDLGNGVIFGKNKTVMMAGPCAVESESQAMNTAEFLVSTFDIKVFRAGVFKPRTSPYSFQGLEHDGLRILEKVRDTFGVKIISEVKDQSHLNEVANVADIIQIGTKSMYLFNLLADCGRLTKPIMLKRGFMSTLKEFLQAVDFIMANGNPNVILCERGLRNFEPQTRFSLDICGAALLKEISHLPLVLDPSHAMGRAAQVPLVAQASAALEVDGLIVETHPNPAEAKSDKEQALSFHDFSVMMTKIRPICSAVGRELV